MLALSSDLNGSLEVKEKERRKEGCMGISAGGFHVGAFKVA